MLEVIQIKVEQKTSSFWRKQPTVNFMQRMTSTSPFDKLQVIGGDGKALPKSPHYKKIKTAEAAYQSFYSIPDKMTDIKLAETEKAEHLKVKLDKPELSLDKLDKLDTQSQNLNQAENKLINLRPDIKPIATSALFPETENKLAFRQIDNHKTAKPEEKGKNVDIYL